MKKAIFFIFLFLAGFAFISLNRANAVTRCIYGPNEVVGARECGQPNYCRGCDLVNDVTTCSTDSNSIPIASSCQTLRTDVHEANSPVCAASCQPPPAPPVCQTITCFGNSGAGGICTYGDAALGKNSDVASCQSDKCGGGTLVPGHTVSVCQSNNCYYNSCECWPNSACPTPAPTPNACPLPPQVTNVRVECPYCQ